MRLRWPYGEYWGRGKPVGVIFVGRTASLVVTLPWWLPGFVKPYQTARLRTRDGRRESDLHLFIPLLPPGRWHTSRTLRFVQRRRR